MVHHEACKIDGSIQQEVSKNTMNRPPHPIPLPQSRRSGACPSAITIGLSQIGGLMRLLTSDLQSNALTVAVEFRSVHALHISHAG
jgi:hypothetical protein